MSKIGGHCTAVVSLLLGLGLSHKHVSSLAAAIMAWLQPSSPDITNQGFNVYVSGVGQGIPMRLSEPLQVGLFTCPLFTQERAAMWQSKACFPLQGKSENLAEAPKAGPGQPPLGSPLEALHGALERRIQGRLLSSREERAPSWWFGGSALCPPLSSVPPSLSPHRGKEGGEGTLKPPGLPWCGPQGKGEKSQSLDTAEPPRAQKSSEAPAWIPGVQRRRCVRS